jgi:hypothetical protein
MVSKFDENYKPTDEKGQWMPGMINTNKTVSSKN